MLLLFVCNLSSVIFAPRVCATLHEGVMWRGGNTPWIIGARKNWRSSCRGQNWTKWVLWWPVSRESWLLFPLLAGVWHLRSVKVERWTLLNIPRLFRNLWNLRVFVWHTETRNLCIDYPSLVRFCKSVDVHLRNACYLLRRGCASHIQRMWQFHNRTGVIVHQLATLMTWLLLQFVQNVCCNCRVL